VRQQWRLRPGKSRSGAAVDIIEQEARRVLARFVHVDVRKRLEADDDVGVVDHRLRDVAVQIERDGERHFGCDGAYAAQQLAFAVVEAPRDHRAVQIEKDRVAALAHGVDDSRGESLECVVVDGSARVGGRVDGDLDLGAASRTCIEKRAKPGARAARGFERCFAERGTVGTE
jgi:hypothetical protein